MGRLALAIAILVALFSVDYLRGESWPACRVARGVTDATRGNAGCLLRAGGRLLVVRHLHGGKLGIPGGLAQQAETAQCTAHRETWEEAGLDVEVGPLLYVFGNGFRLYDCRLEPGMAEAATLTVPRQGRDEITEIFWTDATTLRPEDWRFPDYLEEFLGVAGE